VTESHHRLIGGEAGSAALELVLLAPVFIVLTLFVVGLGRLASARQDVVGAAEAAARAASAATSAATAQSSAQAAAAGDLQHHSISCRHFDVAVDAGDFRSGGSVGAQVSCTVGLADLSLVRFPGSATLSSKAVSIIDNYRSLPR
jgi:Flp pilus assembly protein TadG